MKIKKSITELVGKTPLLEISGFMRETGAKARLLAKLEYLNPAGSVKDRVALAMIEAAEKSGALKRGGTVIEPTSGNTGIGLAAVCAARGYKLIATMPETMSAERISILAAYGAEIVLTSVDDGMRGAIEKAKELRELSVLVGISSGAALCAAVKLAKRKENENKTIVVLLPDSADRYYSTALFN